jgi:hypothetical protein
MTDPYDQKTTVLVVGGGITGLSARAEERGADVRFGTELISVDSDADGVTALVRHLDSRGEYRIRADYLVAADGNRAGIRNQLGIGAEGPGILIHERRPVAQARRCAPLSLARYSYRPRAPERPHGDQRSRALNGRTICARIRQDIDRATTGKGESDE